MFEFYFVVKVRTFHMAHTQQQQKPIMRKRGRISSYHYWSRRSRKKVQCHWSGFVKFNWSRYALSHMQLGRVNVFSRKIWRKMQLKRVKIIREICIEIILTNIFHRLHQISNDMKFNYDFKWFSTSFYLQALFWNKTVS